MIAKPCYNVSMVFASPRYGYTDSDVELAAILEPPPPPDCTNDNGEYDAWIDELEARATGIQLSATDEGLDPLLHALNHLRRRRNDIEQQMILLVAYMRERIRPRPYTLQQIADAAGLSISGTRTFYDSDDVGLLDERIAFARRVLSGRYNSSTPGTPDLPGGQGSAAVAQT